MNIRAVPPENVVLLEYIDIALRDTFLYIQQIRMNLVIVQHMLTSHIHFMICASRITKFVYFCDFLCLLLS